MGERKIVRRKKNLRPLTNPIGRVQKALAEMAAKEDMELKEFLEYVAKEGITAPMLSAQIRCTHQAVSQIYHQVGAETFSLRHDVDDTARALGYKDLKHYLLENWSKKHLKEQAIELKVSLSTLKRRKRLLLKEEEAQKQSKKAG